MGKRNTLSHLSHCDLGLCYLHMICALDATYNCITKLFIQQILITLMYSNHSMQWAFEKIKPLCHLFFPCSSRSHYIQNKIQIPSLPHRSMKSCLTISCTFFFHGSVLPQTLRSSFHFWNLSNSFWPWGFYSYYLLFLKHSYPAHWVTDLL